MNTKGFVISTTLYSIFGIMLITVFYILYMLSNNRMVLLSNINDLRSELEEIIPRNAIEIKYNFLTGEPSSSNIIENQNIGFIGVLYDTAVFKQNSVDGKGSIKYIFCNIYEEETCDVVGNDKKYSSDEYGIKSMKMDTNYIYFEFYGKKQWPLRSGFSGLKHETTTEYQLYKYSQSLFTNTNLAKFCDAFYTINDTGSTKTWDSSCLTMGSSGDYFSLEYKYKHSLYDSFDNKVVNSLTTNELNTITDSETLKEIYENFVGPVGTHNEGYEKYPDPITIYTPSKWQDSDGYTGVLARIKLTDSYNHSRNYYYTLWYK